MNIIDTILGWFKGRYAVTMAAPVAIEGRSSHWATVRNEHLKRQPECQACGKTANLNVHHIKPFHVYPELELVDSNLVTLCEDPTRLCHYRLGHAFLWKGWNPDVLADAARSMKEIEQSKQLAQTPCKVFCTFQPDN